MKKQFFKRTLALISFLGMVSFTSAQTYKFDSAGELEGFVKHTDFSTLEQADMADTDGVMIFTMPDPNDLVPTSMRVDQTGVINATDNKFMTIRLKNNTDVTNLRLKIQNDPAKWTVPIVLDTNMSDFKTYSFRISNVEWTGDLSNIFFQFRIPGRQMPITGISIIIDEIVFSSSLSTNDVVKDNAAVNLSPNPVKDILTISFNENSRSVNKVEIYDLSGKKVLFEENTKKLDVTNMSKGIYIAKIYQDSDVISIKRFVKK